MPSSNSQVRTRERLTFKKWTDWMEGTRNRTPWPSCSRRRATPSASRWLVAIIRALGIMQLAHRTRVEFLIRPSRAVKILAKLQVLEETMTWLWCPRTQTALIPCNRRPVSTIVRRHLPSRIQSQRKITTMQALNSNRDSFHPTVVAILRISEEVSKYSSSLTIYNLLVWWALIRAPSTSQKLMKTLWPSEHPLTLRSKATVSSIHPQVSPTWLRANKILRRNKTVNLSRTRTSRQESNTKAVLRSKNISLVVLIRWRVRNKKKRMIVQWKGVLQLPLRVKKARNSVEILKIQGQSQ